MRSGLISRPAGTYCSSCSHTAPRVCSNCRLSSMPAPSALPSPSASGAMASRSAADTSAIGHPAGPSNRGTPALDGPGSDDGTPTAAAATLPGALATAAEPQGFPFWADEVLWSQGKPAVELIEQVLQQLGGHRTGGPPRTAAPTSGTATDLNPNADVDADADADADVEAGPSSSSGGGGAWQRCSAAASGSSTPAAASSSSAPAAADDGGRSSSGRPWSESDLGYSHMDAWVFLWTKSVYAIKAARSLRPGQLVSAVVGLNSLTMKKRMVLTLRQALGERAWSVMPQSFALPEELPQWEQWLRHHRDADSGLWILKTGQDAGKGLRLLPTSRALQYASRLARSAIKPRNQLKVAQTYVTRPLLLKQRKFHLRLWLLVTGHSPLRAYLHTNGLVLFSSEVYKADKPLEAGVKPAAGHVTNYARNEDTWVWDMEGLASELGREVFERLWGDMAAATAATAAAALRPMLAAHEWLQPAVPDYGFQVLGLDFLIDEAMRPWLLELNSAPSIMAIHSDSATCAMIAGQKSGMLSDTLAMVSHRFLPQAAAQASGHGQKQQQQRQQQQQQGQPHSCGIHAGGSLQLVSLPWQQQLQLELAHRGGYQPLMPLFSVLQQEQEGERGSAADGGGIPWQPQDFELQQLMRQQEK